MSSAACPVVGTSSSTRQLSPTPQPYPYTTSTSTTNTQDGTQDGPNVLSRLHALFRADTREESAHSRRMSFGERLERARTGPADTPGSSVQSIKDREAIKVFMITWNMGDSLPKGDLSVLLGTVPTYEPPQETEKDTIPKLPIENKHPYHIIVVAGQECPTPSGVPRGLGGVMKGMSVRVGHHKKKEKDKEENKKDEESDSSSSSDEEEQPPRTASPLPPTPSGTKSQAQKGWSTMLDDWFCGPTLRTNQGGNSPTAPNSPRLHPASTSLAPAPPALARSSSAPEVIQAETPTVPIPRQAPPSPSILESSLPPNFLAPQLATSPLSRGESSNSSSPASSGIEDNLDLPPPLPRKEGGASLPVNSRPDRPGLVIPVTEPARTGMGTGSYVHVIKERLMGMYISVYVYKGCEHLVQGVDKDFVTAGLAGGRLGNKGAILKLADHRFLFVNSHLAAHTKRVSARLANIIKIKAELNLDTFLPKDDPRNNEADIADRFDSVFWCGDLNFRLDMSRLHAQWLVEQKNYPELLMWDQLRGVMKDPDNNPFPGFCEAPIDFAPTFKYDVWKSVRTTNRILRRTLKRSGTIDGRRDTGAKEVAKDLAKSLTPITMEEEESEDHYQTSEYLTDSQSRRSFSSERPSFAGTDDDSDVRSEKHIDSTAYGSRHKALEVAIKSKTKKFLSYCKLDVLARDKDKDDGKRKRNVSGGLGKSPRESVDVSRRTSMSSVVSFQSRLAPPTPAIEVPSTPPQTLPIPLPMTPTSYNGDMRRPSIASSRLTASPPQRPPPVRRMSILKRTVSGRSVNTGEGDEVDMEADTREGIYDTSKKQRVPSWCDRVLWKAHVEPDPEVPADDLPVPREKKSSRISHVLSNFGGHIRASMVRSPSMENSPYARAQGSLPSTPPPASGGALVDSPTASPTLRGRGLQTEPEEMLLSNPKARSTPPALSPLSSSARHPLLDHSTIPSSPSRPTITFEFASPSAKRDRPDHDHDLVNFRPRANSDVPAHGPKPPFRQHNSAGNETSAANTTSSLNMHRESSHSPPRPRPAENLMLHHSKSENTPSTSTTHVDREEQRGAFMKFIRDLPNMLPGRNVLSAPVPYLSEEQIGAKLPRRHQKGEVVCLHYGTIDDLGMRQLEGRSDHRPAIFSAAVYV